MSENPTISTLYTPAIESLLPMFYVAWADRVLSPSEVKLLQSKINELHFLDAQEKNILKQWMNPAQPPSRELFKHWELKLQEVSQHLSVSDKKSLVSLGIAMARQSAVKYIHHPSTFSLVAPETRQALEELETSLGLIKIDTYKRIFHSDLEDEEQLKIESVNARFNAKDMAALLQGNYASLIQRVKILLQDPVFDRSHSPLKEDHRNRVRSSLKVLADQGWGALAYPKPYGGQDDMGAYAAVFETLGLFDGSLQIKFGVQFGLFGGSIHHLGTEKHHIKYLKPTGTLELLGCFAMTETGHGSNVRQLETTATYDAQTDELIVHSPRVSAGKEYIGNALDAKLASVFCQLIVNGENHGVHAVLVPLRNEAHELLPGIKVEDNGYKMGLNGVDNGRIWFEHVRVPRENLLNRFGSIDEQGEYSSPIENPSSRFFTMLGTLVGGRVCVPRGGLSAAKSGLAIAIRYALKRRQFGPSFTEPETLLLDYPSHQRRLMPLLAKTYAVHFGLQYLTERYLAHQKEDIREIETLAAGMKAYATWFTTAALQACREACGGKGYLSENRFAALKGDTEIFTTFEGDNTVLMLLVAKGVLTKFRNEFNEEGVTGILRFVGERVTTTLAEMNPIAVRRTSREHLLDSNMHLQAFLYRENRLKVSVSQRMRGLIKQGMSAYDAALNCQTHMLALAEAFVENTILQEFIHVINRQEDIPLKNVLKHLCDLYALHTIEQHKGWFLEQGYMESIKTKAIRRLIDELCAVVRTDALALVHSFDIPNALLGAKIV